ncbi:unnamed protein product [Clonostachys rhizophaga]|uniref:Uncharacterized protein n=1 Tax=Clonostachys rhizophaga TaxID=160324 RepID=A0A9N9YIZ4_9HYPO|nr:unnamed protein product [Clonostachys rhizophaga]
MPVRLFVGRQSELGVPPTSALDARLLVLCLVLKEKERRESNSGNLPKPLGTELVVVDGYPQRHAGQADVEYMDGLSLGGRDGDGRPRVRVLPDFVAIPSRLIVPTEGLYAAVCLLVEDPEEVIPQPKSGELGFWVDESVDTARYHEQLRPERVGSVDRRGGHGRAPGGFDTQACFLLRLGLVVDDASVRDGRCVELLVEYLHIGALGTGGDGCRYAALGLVNGP